jgi:glycosyltransferase involved in cell wall biosynthesis
MFAHRSVSRNGDRIINRFWDYPRLFRQISDFDVYHVVDHSYSHLVHYLPAARTIVTCHDLDTFRCLLDPAAEKRPAWFKKMSRRTLDGLRKAAHVVCVSAATRNQLLAAELVTPDRASVVWNGVHPECAPTPDSDADQEAARLLGPADLKEPEIVHVGSTIPRKRIDTLLNVFANIRDAFPSARLIRVGGPFTAGQGLLMERLGLEGSVVSLPFMSNSVLAALYRRAALVLQTSEREGFGLPVAEAMACGAVVIASRIPALLEVGGTAAEYCPVADLDAWTHASIRLLRERAEQTDSWLLHRERALTQACQFSWKTCAAKMTPLYQRLSQ